VVALSPLIKEIFMRAIIGIAIVMWAAQGAQAQTAVYEFIDVGSAQAGTRQLYSAFLLDYRENKFYECSASYTRGQAPTANCRENPAYTQQSVIPKGSPVQSVLHTDYTRNALPLGLWQVDQQRGIAQFCIVNPVICVNVTPK
jgi:hypothetical protein